MVESNRPLRVLHIVGRMARGGAETMIMNYYRHIDRSKLQFDFLTMMPGNHDYNSEITALGGRIFLIPPPNKAHPIKHLMDLISVMRQKGPFLAVHAHTMHHSGLVMLAARIAGVKIRISHSHSTSDWGVNLFSRKLYFDITKVLIKTYANKMLACGKDAGVYLFGKKLVNSGKVIILPNALDLDPYRSLNKDERNMLRHQLGIPEDTLVLGHVGRFSPQKNHAFFISLMKQIKSLRPNICLILVGDGPLRQQIEDQVARSGLASNIIFLGVRSDIPQLMNMFDVFVFPSIFEGLPVVLIEAQAAGTPSIVSSEVTKEADMGLNLLRFIDLTSNIEDWCSAILDQSKQIKPSWKLIMTRLNERGYDVNASIANLLKIYSIV